MIEKSLEGWAKSLRANARGVWLSELDVISFTQSMDAGIRRYFNMAWNEGAAICGIKPDERTPEENQALNEQMLISSNAIFGLWRFINENSKENNGLWRKTLARLELWKNSYSRVFELAKQMSCKNKKLLWQYGATEHCNSCRRLNGKVYRASTWQQMGIYPKSPLLECGGFRCQCRLVPTKLRLTPGRRQSFKEIATPIAFEVWLKKMIDSGVIYVT